MSLKFWFKGVSMLVVVSLIWSFTMPASAATKKYVSNQTIVDEMVSKMLKVDSYNFEGKVSVKPPKDKLEDVSMFLNNGDKIQVAFYGSQMGNKMLGATERSHFSVFLNSPEGISTYPHLETITDNDDSYFKFSNLNWFSDLFKSYEQDIFGDQEIPTSSMNISSTEPFTFSLINSVNNQWIKISKDSVKNLLGLLGFSTSDLKDFENISPKNELSQQQIVDLLKSVKKNKLINITRLKDEKIDDTAVYHLKLQINKSRIKPFLVDAAKITKEEITGAELNRLVTDMQKTDLPLIELWVQQDDYLVRKASMNIVIKESAEKNAPKTDMQINLLMSGYNTVSFISLPQVYRTIEEISAEIAGKFGLNNL